MAPADELRTTAPSSQARPCGSGCSRRVSHEELHWPAETSASTRHCSPRSPRPRRLQRHACAFYADASRFFRSFEAGVLRARLILSQLFLQAILAEPLSLARQVRRAAGAKRGGGHPRGEPGFRLGNGIGGLLEKLHVLVPPRRPGRPCHIAQPGCREV
jgi:hypothetical protein